MILGTTPWDLSDRSAAGLVAQAVAAERLGYHSFWLPESHFGENAIPDPLLLLAAVAASTREIRLGTTSLLLPLRNPLQTAEQVAVLDQLCSGRVILGVGRGYAPPMLRAFDVDPRAKRALFEDHLGFMLRAWAGEPIGSERSSGADVHADAGQDVLRLDPLPFQRPHPPIWVAAMGPKALAQAGRMGLPYLSSPIETLDQLEQNYARHAAAVADAGHGQPADVPVMRTLFVTNDGAETRFLREKLAAVGWQNARLSAATDVEQWAFIGESGYIRERVAELRERLGVTHLIVTRLRLSGISLGRLEENAARAMAILG